MKRFDPSAYWNVRYASGRTSGEGSEGAKAVAKARFINQMICDNDVHSVVDWGVGDGHVLSMIADDVDYLGVDISTVAIRRLRHLYRGVGNRSFITLEQAGQTEVEADMAISADVIFHCIEDSDYEAHLRNLFSSARSVVLIHSSDIDNGQTARHVRWRKFTPDVARIAPDWKLTQAPALADDIGWHVYRREAR